MDSIVTERRYQVPADNGSDAALVVARVDLPDRWSDGKEGTSGGVNIVDETGERLWFAWTQVRDLAAALIRAADDMEAKQ